MPRKRRQIELSGWVDLVHLVGFVYLVRLIQPNKRDKPNKPEQPPALSIERFSSIAEQIIVGREGFVSRIGGIDLDNIELFLVSWCAM